MRDVERFFHSGIRKLLSIFLPTSNQYLFDPHAWTNSYYPLMKSCSLCHIKHLKDSFYENQLPFFIFSKMVISVLIIIFLCCFPCDFFCSKCVETFNFFWSSTTLSKNLFCCKYLGNIRSHTEFLDQLPGCGHHTTLWLAQWL